MLTLFFSAPLAALGSALNALTNRIDELLTAVQQAHATAARFETLAQLSDDELARRGLKREGLAQAVLAAAEA
jgi:hypothetical protein